MDKPWFHRGEKEAARTEVGLELQTTSPCRLARRAEQGLGCTPWKSLQVATHMLSGKQLGLLD